MTQGVPITDSQKEKALKAIARGKTVSQAARAAGMDRSTLWKLRQNDRVFADRFDEVYQEATDMLEERAWLLALGTNIAGQAPTLPEPSMIKFMLQARRPETYRAPSKDPRSDEQAKIQLIEKLARDRGVDPAPLIQKARGAGILE